jgi:hypothetical protein
LANTGTRKSCFFGKADTVSPAPSCKLFYGLMLQPGGSRARWEGAALQPDLAQTHPYRVPVLTPTGMILPYPVR